MNNNFSLYLYHQQTVSVEFCFLKIGLRINRMNTTFRSFLQKLPSKGFCHYLFGRFPISSNYQLQPVEQNFEREDNLARYSQIFKNFSPEVFFRGRVRISLNSTISNFPKTFPGNFRSNCHRFQKIGSFGGKESALCFFTFSPTAVYKN